MLDGIISKGSLRSRRKDSKSSSVLLSSRGRKTEMESKGRLLVSETLGLTE